MLKEVRRKHNLSYQKGMYILIRRNKMVRLIWIISNVYLFHSNFKHVPVSLIKDIKLNSFYPSNIYEYTCIDKKCIPGFF